MLIEHLLIPSVLLRPLWDFLGNAGDPGIWVLLQSLIKPEKT